MYQGLRLSSDHETMVSFIIMNSLITILNNNNNNLLLAALDNILIYKQYDIVLGGGMATLFMLKILDVWCLLCTH